MKTLKNASLFIATLWALLLIAVPSQSNFAQVTQPNNQAEQAVLKTLDEVLTALVKRDGAVIERVFTDDYFTVYDGGQVGDRARLVNSLKSATSGWDDWQRMEAKVKLHDNTAIALCRYQVKGHNSQGSFAAHWRSTSVWLKERGQWRLAASQFTSIKPPAPSTPPAQQ